MTKIEDRKARMAANGKLMDDSWQRFQESRERSAEADGSGYDTPEGRAVLADLDPIQPRPVHHVQLADDDKEGGA